MIRHVFIFAPLLSLLACSYKAPTDPNTGVFDGDQQQAGPGTEAWAKEDVTCETNADCFSGEACLSNVCQPSQCEGGLTPSAAPMGTTFTFFGDNEIGIADATSYDGEYWVDTYTPDGTGTDYEGSTPIAGTKLVDLSGGRFEKTQQAKYVAAIEGRSSIGFAGTGTTDWVSLSFQPAALDAGDTDADGLDEVVVVSENGQINSCHMDSGTCEGWSFSADDGLSILDVAVGDVDGDAVSEVALLLEVDGDRLIYVMNQDHEDKAQPPSYQQFVDDAIRIDVGDANGDREAEIIALVDVNNIPLWGEEDKIVVFNITPPVSGDFEDAGGLTMLSEETTNDLEELQDIEASDTDADGFAEIFAVDSTGQIASYDIESTTLYQRFNRSLDVNVDPFRVALADTDGDSPQATLMDGPTLAKGAPIPAAMILMPPYDIDNSAGPSSSFYGASENTSETFADTISLGMRVDVGLKADLFGMFGASFSTDVGWRVRQTFGEGIRTSVGERFGMSADPEMYGPYHGAVVLYWGCFETYTYEINDPNEHASEMDGETFVLSVPVGGSSSVWSLARYNALAEALGTLPVLDVPYAVGDIEDYPSMPERIDGTSIPDEDMVFSDIRWYTSPDVGSISYRQSISEETSYRSSWDTSMGSSAGVTVGGVKVGVGIDYGWGESYALRLGEGAMFSGKVGAVPDKPDTPEDEYLMYNFRFAPVVYRHWYENASGGDAALYVMTYAAER
jgi:hypothetical protein